MYKTLLATLLLLSLIFSLPAISIDRSILATHVSDTLYSNSLVSTSNVGISDEDKLGTKNTLVLADSYEPDNSATQFKTISISSVQQNQDHTIHSTTDQDWYRFMAYSGRTYRLYTTGSTDTELFFYKDDGTTLLGNIDYGPTDDNFLAEFTPNTPGNYKFKIVGHGGSTGAYRIFYQYVSTPDSYEFDGDPNMLGEDSHIVPKVSVTSQDHTLNINTDIDWFVFYGDPLATYRFESTGYTDTMIKIYKSDLTTIVASADDGGDGQNFLLTYTPASRGYYYIKVSGSILGVGAYGFNYSYTPLSDEYEPDNSVSQAKILSFNGVENEQHHTLHTATDQDWYRFYALPGRKYTVLSTGSVDTKAVLYNDAGTTQLVTSDNESDGVLNFFIMFDPPVAGYYKIKVIGKNGATGLYDLEYAALSVDDTYEPDNTAATANTIGPYYTEMSQSHTIGSINDQDWYSFLGQAGLTYKFYTTGYTNTKIDIYSADGITLLGSNDDGPIDFNCYYEFTPSEDNTYMLLIRSSTNSVGAYVLYYVSSTPSDTFEPDNSAAQFTTILPSLSLQSVTHSFHIPSDQDWFRFYATVGFTYDIYTTNGADPDIVLYKDDGTTVVMSDSDSGEIFNAAITFVPTQSGYYKLRLTSYGDNTGFYKLNYSYRYSLATPSSLRLSLVSGSLYLQWNSVPDATSYRIEASDNPLTGFALYSVVYQPHAYVISNSLNKFFRVIALK